MSANDQSDNEMKPGAVHRSPEKPQLGERLMQAF